MAYERVNWQDYPSKATPLNAENLNKMDEGIANLDAESESLKAFGNEGKLVYVHDGALDTLEPSNLDLHVGSPTVVTEAAQMTDSSKIYVYNGDETGYAAGDWYSYDGEQWVDRGPFNEPEIVTDKELTVSDRPADGKAVGDRLETKANIDGAYDGMTVGSAEQLISTVFVQDNDPYIFRTAGGYADIGDRMQDSIIGGSVVWNQQLLSVDQIGTGKWRVYSTTYGTISYEDGELTYTITSVADDAWSNTIESSNFIKRKDHVVLISHDIYVPKACSVTGSYFQGPNPVNVSVGWNHIDAIEKVNSSNDGASIYNFFGIIKANTAGYVVGDTYKIKNAMFIDLTQMFGTEIADFIYYIEQANPGAGVSIFRKMFPKSYYEYNPGEIKSLTGLAAHETTGFNQWDEEWEIGNIDSSGNNGTGTSTIRTKGYIEVVPSTSYYFETDGYFAIIYWYDSDKTYISSNSPKDSIVVSPANARYLRFYMQSTYGTTYNHDICINLSWDGERDGEYEPYIKHTYPLDSSITLRGMLHRDVDGNFHWHGDKYESDGTVTRKYGIVDLGTLDWGRFTDPEKFYAPLPSGAKGCVAGQIANIICTKYIPDTTANVSAHSNDKIISIGADAAIYLYDSSYSDAAAFKTAMDGVMLVYELANLTTEQAEPFAINQIVDDFGTEAYTFTDGAFEMPVGHESKYTNNLRAKLEMAPNSPSGDGKYLVKQENGLNEYVPYVEHDPTKANIDGNYEEMTVGNAEQLVSTVTVNDQAPYTFRTAGGSADIGDRLTESIVGGTVAWNQLGKLRSSTQTSDSITFTPGDGKITVAVSGEVSVDTVCLPFADYPTFISNHVYYFCGCPSDGDWTTQHKYMMDTGAAIGRDYGNGSIGRYNGESGSKYVYIYIGPAASEGTYIFKPQLFDLTQMFGSDVADHIHVLEQANPGDGVAWFKKLFPEDYYPYDEGSLKSVEGLQSHETVGFNAWDEEWESGSLNGATGEEVASVDWSRSDFIRSLPNTTYYINVEGISSTNYVYVFAYDANKEFIGIVDSFSANKEITTPANCGYIRLQYKRTIATVVGYKVSINLSWDGERDGEYEPYIKRTYPLDSSLTLRGIPKLDESDASLYYDGDRYNPDGTVERRYGIVDLGTLSWDRTKAGYFYSTSIKTIIKKGSTAGRYDHVRCPLYVAANYGSLNSLPDKSVSVDSSGNLQIHDGGYETGPELKAAMSGVYLVYELAEPTIEEAEPFQSPQVVDDFGTEAYTFTEGSFVMPVGHDSKYQLNLRAKLEMAPNSPSSDGAYLLSRYNGQNSYIPYVAPRGIPMINPSEDGEYELILTMSNGTPTLEWVRVYYPDQS